MSLVEGGSKLLRSRSEDQVIVSRDIMGRNPQFPLIRSGGSFWVEESWVDDTPVPSDNYELVI